MSGYTADFVAGIVTARLQARSALHSMSIVCSEDDLLTDKELLAFASSHVLQGPSHCVQVAL